MITGHEKDFDGMVKILEREYGDPMKLVGIVIGDLKSLERLTERNDRFREYGDGCVVLFRFAEGWTGRGDEL